MGTPAPVSRTNKKTNVMLQKAKKKYTVDTLKPLNVLYDHEHWLTQQDVDMANNYVELIERTRSEKTPQVGDRLIYVDRYGKYYGNALIEKREETSGLIFICEEPYIPFVWEEYDGIGLSVSGGSFHHIAPRQLTFVRWTEGAFKDWGNCGACANGAVAFTARVPLWSYSEPNPLYGDFTTETWRQYFLTKDTSPEARNLYQGFDKAFRTEEDFQQFLKDYEGTVFKGNWENQIVL